MDNEIALSGVEIYREQNHNRGVYFKQDDYIALAKILLEKWNINSYTSTDSKSKHIHKIEKRTISFAKDYQNIVTSI